VAAVRRFLALETHHHFFPDFVAKGLRGELKAARLWIELPMGPRYFVVVYREANAKDGFIITARLGSGVSNLIKGGVIWRRK
jgi:hypothetical protein